MKLEQIMKEKESLLGGRWFKRKHKDYCVRWNKDEYLFEMLLENCRNKDKTITVYHFNPEDFVVDDWGWVEEWYEGDFKKKYPNGVLCYVWDEIPYHKKYDIAVVVVVVDYVQTSKYPFVAFEGNYWKYAEPVKSNEAPAIIGE